MGQVQVPEKTLLGRGGGEESGPAGLSAVAITRTHPLPSQVHREPIILDTRKAHFFSVGRTWPPAVSWFQQVILPFFHPTSPSSRLPQEGPILPLHPAAPERKCYWFPLDQGLAPGCKGGDN